MYNIDKQLSRCLYIFFLVWLTGHLGISAPVQSPPLVSGPTTVCAGSTHYYSVSGLRDVMWTVEGGGVIVSTGSNTCHVRWTSSGTVRAYGSLPGNTGGGEPEPGGDDLRVNVTFLKGTISIGPLQSLTSGGESIGKDDGRAQLQTLSTSYQCAPASAGLTLTDYAGTIVQWEKSTDRNYWEPIANTSVYYQLSGIYTTTYFRVLLKAGNCSQYSSEATVQIAPPPSPPTVRALARCGPGTVTIRPSGAPAGSYYRFYDRNNGYLGSGSAYTASVSGTTWYQVSVYSGGSCESAKARVDVTVNYTPEPGQPAMIEYCGYTILRYWPGTGPHYWQPTPGDTLTDNATPEFKATQGGNYYVKIKNPTTGCWSPASTVTASVKYEPPVPSFFDIEETPGCRNVTLSVAYYPPSLGIAYYWQDTPDGTDTTRSGPVTATAPGRHYLRALRDGCWSPSSLVYEVSSIPDNVSCLGSQNLNYVVTDILKKEGVIHESQLVTLTAAENAQQVEYMDGFGRTIQQVVPQGSPTKKDIVQLFTYDALGRETKAYLPFTTANDGRYNENALATLSGFYNAPQGQAIAATTRPWAETVFEASPLGRIKEQGSEGEAWQIGTGGTARFFEQTNTANEVRLWRYDFASGQCSSTTYYAAGALKVDLSVDENGSKSWTYSDKDGNVVLQKKEVSATEQAQTYYVYDDFSQVRMVIQPEGVKELIASNISTPDAAFISKWCYTYAYDNLGRIIEKKVPNAAAEHFVYNRRDQLILSQDGEQRKRGAWTFTKYNALNRPVITGVYKHAASRAQLQQMADAHAGQYETRTAANYNTQFGYTTSGSFPVLDHTNSTIHAVSYYDDYNFDFNSATPDAAYVSSGMNPEPAAVSETINRLTGSLVRVEEPVRMLLTTLFYDKWGNVIQQQDDNHLGGKDISTKRYNFSGQLLETRHTHHIEGQTPVKIRKTYAYDHAGRERTVKHQVNGGTDVTVAAFEFNELGQPIQKKLHSTDGSGYLQNVDYRYNIRGWLSKINDVSLTDPSDFFGLELRYNEAPLSRNGNSYRNGALAEAIYLSRMDDKQKAYTFDYDRSGKMTDSHYAEKGITGWSNQLGAFDEKGITYDLNGNIRTLQRWGVEQGVKKMTHDLQYTYSGNCLLNITNSAPDASPVPDRDFPRPEEEPESFTGPSAATNAGFRYDANGNMLCDRRRNIDSVTYNHLNLVEKVFITGKGSIRYRYDAAGTRISREVTDSTGAVDTRYYVGPFEYDNNKRLEFFPTGEGRVIMTGTTPEYQYHLTDHEGNVRMTFSSVPQVTTSVATLETSNAASEQRSFEGLDRIQKVDHALFDHTRKNGSHYAMRLSGRPNERIGLGKSLSVTPGDVINMEVYAKYIDNDKSNWTSALTNIMAAVSMPAQSPAVDAMNKGVSGNIAAFGDLLNKERSRGDGPKAYLNYLIFDMDYRLKNGGYVQLSGNAKENGTAVPHERMEKSVTITEPGYMYVYLSNENETPVEVFFDDFTVEQVRSYVTHQQEYYPLGSVLSQYQREASVDQAYLFEGLERQEILGLDWIDYLVRMYDPEIGICNTIAKTKEIAFDGSQYTYVRNSPFRFDVDGPHLTFHHRNSEAFNRAYRKAFNYLYDGGLRAELEELQSLKGKYQIVEKQYEFDEMPTFSSFFLWIEWIPNQVLVTNRDDHYHSSPAEGLYHEFHHLISADKDPEGHKARQQQKVEKMTNKEEERVTTGPEQDAGRKLGKLGKDQVTRKDHYYITMYKTDDPTYPNAEQHKEIKAQKGLVREQLKPKTNPKPKQKPQPKPKPKGEEKKKPILVAPPL